ncbi:hypothetical protein GGI35DRAFT_40093 [Trichoderma velutinum]
MFRPKGNTGLASRAEASATERIHQSNFQSARNGVDLNTSAASTSGATQQTMFHPVASASRLAHQDMLQPVSQPADNARAYHTLSTQPFQRPPRFLLSTRGNLEPINASTTSTSRVTRPGARLIDSIESDVTPPLPANVSATSTSHIIRTASRPVDSIESNAPPPLPTSRKTRRPMLQLLRDAGPANPEPDNILSNSTTRSPQPSRLPDRTETGQNTVPATQSPVTYQTIPQPVNSTKPSRMPITSTSRVAQNPTPQPTRNAMPVHASTASTSRIARQPTIQPTRTLPTQNTSVSSSRISQQSTFRPLKTTAAPANTPTPSTSSSILEFICLYSHDLRRKKKRWQDGKLKFHTFNKKYVVYDDGGGFVGDGHWQGDEGEFTEGLEMNLDRGMAIVQVLECTGSKEQDLGEVLGKRAREVEERRVNAATKNPASTASSNPAKRSRGIAAVLQAAPAAVATAAITTITTTAIPPSRNGGAWSKHAVDLLGMTRPSR